MKIGIKFEDPDCSGIFIAVLHHMGSTLMYVENTPPKWQVVKIVNKLAYGTFLLGETRWGWPVVEQDDMEEYLSITGSSVYLDGEVDDYMRSISGARDGPFNSRRFAVLQHTLHQPEVTVH